MGKFKEGDQQGFREVPSSRAEMRVDVWRAKREVPMRCPGLKLRESLLPGSTERSLWGDDVLFLSCYFSTQYSATVNILPTAGVQRGTQHS